jgi:hypothetical protein
MHETDGKGTRWSPHRMSVGALRVRVRMEVEVTVSPADEERTARKTIRAATAVSAPCCIRSGR